MFLVKNLTDNWITYFTLTYFTIVESDVVKCRIIVSVEVVVVILILIKSYVIIRSGYVAVNSEVPHLLAQLLHFSSTYLHPY